MAAQMVQTYNIYQTRKCTSWGRKQETECFLHLKLRTLLCFHLPPLKSVRHLLLLLTFKLHLHVHNNLQLHLRRILVRLNLDEFMGISAFTVAIGN